MLREVFRMLLPILRHIPLNLAGADVQDLDLDVFGSNAGAEIVIRKSILGTGAIMDFGRDERRNRSNGGSCVCTRSSNGRRGATRSPNRRVWTTNSRR